MLTRSFTFNGREILPSSTYLCHWRQQKTFNFKNCQWHFVSQKIQKPQEHTWDHLNSIDCTHCANKTKRIRGERAPEWIWVFFAKKWVKGWLSYLWEWRSEALILGGDGLYCPLGVSSCMNKCSAGLLYYTPARHHLWMSKEWNATETTAHPGGAPNEKLKGPMRTLERRNMSGKTYTWTHSRRRTAIM